MVRVRHCLFCPFPLPFLSCSFPFSCLFLYASFSFSFPFSCPFSFPFSFPFPFLFLSFFLSSSFCFLFPFPFLFLSLSFSPPFPILSFPFLYYSFFFSLSSLMWILCSRCEASAWKNDKREKTIFWKNHLKGLGFFYKPPCVVFACLLGVWLCLKRHVCVFFVDSNACKLELGVWQQTWKHNIFHHIQVPIVDGL